MTARRQAVWVGLVLALGACAAPPGAAPAGPAAPPATETSPSLPGVVRIPPEVEARLRVPDPLDARGVPACALLTDAQLAELGLDPASDREDDAPSGEGCNWRYTDRPTSAGVGISTGPDTLTLGGLYRLAGDSPGFEILEVAGHPAVRDPTEPGSPCILYVAIAPTQTMALDAGAAVDRELPDPCAPARRMAEMVLSNLPPLS